MRFLASPRAMTSIGLAAIGLLTIAFVGHARAASTGIPEPTCAPLDAFAVKIVREGLKQEYRPSHGGCTLAIDLAACATPSRANEIVYSNGWGHSWGTTITITALRRDGDSVQVTRLMLTRGGSTIAKWAGETSDSVKVLRGVVDGAKIEEAMSVAAVVPAFSLREVAPPSNGLGFGGWMSSSDFLASVTLVAPGVTTDRSFVGYSASDTQLASLPLSFATARLDAAIPAASLTSSSLDSAARALFVAEAMRRAPEFDEEFHWWVREAFVRAAGDGGDLSLVPLLRRHLTTSDPSSGERTRIAAISALAAITGDDRRFTAGGIARPVDVVALEYSKMLASK